MLNKPPRATPARNILPAPERLRKNAQRIGESDKVASELILKNIGRKMERYSHVGRIGINALVPQTIPTVGAFDYEKAMARVLKELRKKGYTVVKRIAPHHVQVRWQKPRRSKRVMRRIKPDLKTDTRQINRPLNSRRRAVLEYA